MKLVPSAILVSSICFSALGADSTPNLQDPKERISYSLGVDFGENLRRRSVEVNPDTILKGLQDGLAGQPKLTPEEVREAFNDLRSQINARMTELAKENKETGEKFLAENAKKEGVKTLPSGLQYKVIKAGSGESPKATDEVQVKYTGRLIDGTVFDSTDKQGGQPARFRVNGVIKGWTEALQLMSKGAQWEIYIPSELAYGERGAGNSIPPNSVLIFDVELIDILPAPQAPPTPGGQVTSDIIKVPSAEELKKGAKIEVLKPEDVEREIQKEKARKENEAKK